MGSTARWTEDNVCYSQGWALGELKFVAASDIDQAYRTGRLGPDDIELANGVATVEVQGQENNTVITLVSQMGAVSVTNPKDDTIPEEVTVTILPSGSVVPARLTTSSSLVPLGGTVMTWRDDYSELAGMLIAISDAFAETTGKTAYALGLTR